MTSRLLKRRWLKTKIALSQTIQRILDINRRRKVLSKAENVENFEQQLQEELRVLNRIADQQARMLRKYEADLTLRLQEERA